MNKIIFLTVVLFNIIVDISHKVFLQNTIFKVYDGTEMIVWSSIVNALLLIPFLLLFSTSGYLSDKFSKGKVFVISSFLSFAISVLMTASYFIGNFHMAMILLLVLGIQSAIYSPAKYGLIKNIFGKENIVKGNSLVQSVTMIGILATMGIFSYLFEQSYSMLTMEKPSTEDIMNGMMFLTLPITVIALLEFLFSLKFLKIKVETDSTKILNKQDLIKGKLLKENIQCILTKENVFLSIMGLTVFWAISQGLVAVFPAYAKEYFDVTNTFTINALIACSGIGIAIGSFIYSMISKKYINVGILPFVSMGIVSSLYTLIHVSSVEAMALLFLTFGIFGGMFVVPLNSIIQFNSEEKHLGTILAGNNWFQSLGMVLMLTLTTVMALMSLNSLYLMYTIMIITILGTLYVMYNLPHPIISLFTRLTIGLKYRMTVKNLENIPAEKGVLLLGNHVSWIDWAILQLSLPRTVNFVMYKGIYDKWYLKWLFKKLPIIPISGGASKGSMELVAQKLNNGEVVAIFPEGAITRTGNLTEFKKGFELILNQTNENVDVISFYIKGLWESKFSRSSIKYQSNNDSEVSVTFSKPITNPNVNSVKHIVQELAFEAWDCDTKKTESLPNKIFDAMFNNRKETVVSDSTGTVLNGSKFLTSTILFKNLLKNRIQGQNIGILVPSTAAGAITNTSILMLGKTCVNINYTAELNGMKEGLLGAGVKTVVASKKFIQKIEAKKINISSLLESFEVIYLEDLKTEISKFSMISTLISTYLIPDSILKSIHIKNVRNTETALLLFSSGSEGTSKGIELSHQNVLANIKQTASILNVNNNDVIVGSLPLFHAFGITVTTLLPLVEGIHMTAHPDPTDGLGIGKLVHKHNATIMCGTSTFFRLYTMNKKVQPMMFDSLRYIVAGAEKLSEKVKDDFKIKFGKDILEGYGATETSPVATCNMPDILSPELEFFKGNKPGTVGLSLPGTHIMIVDPQDLEEYKTSKRYREYVESEMKIKLSEIKLSPLNVGEEGMILIGGPQVMKGYFNNPMKTEESIVIINNRRYYITGDKGRLDNDNFLTIVDRYSRFAKLGGEMISLGAVESEFSKTLQELHLEIDFLASAIKDEKKGEKIVMLLSGENIDISKIKGKMIEMFENKLMIPSDFYIVDEIPKLGSGKKDFKGAQKLAEELTK